MKRISVIWKFIWNLLVLVRNNNPDLLTYTIPYHGDNVKGHEIKASPASSFWCQTFLWKQDSKGSITTNDRQMPLLQTHTLHKC